MISEKQLEANRSNALLSTGPKTDAGRKRSRTNALRHGLTGQVTTMTDEDRAAHDQFSKALMKSLAPEGATVTLDEKVRPYPRDVLARGSTGGRQLAQRIATDSWRLNRASAIEDNLFTLGLHENGGKLCPEHEQIDAALTTARVFTMESKQLQLLTLYEQRINRNLQKNLFVAADVHAYLSSLPLALAGLGYILLQVQLKPPRRTLLKRLVLAATFLLWSVVQLLPPGRLGVFLGDAVIAAYVLDLFWMMQDQGRSCDSSGETVARSMVRDADG